MSESISKDDLNSMENRLSKQLESIQSLAQENSRVLRGSNGDGGLIGRIIKIETTCGARYLASKQEHSYLEEKTVDWIQVAKSIFLPVTLSILGSIVTAIILLQIVHTSP